MSQSMYASVQRLLAFQTPLEFLVSLEEAPEQLAADNLETLRLYSESPLWPRQRARIANILHVATSCAECGVGAVRDELLREKIRSWQDYAEHHATAGGDEACCVLDPGADIEPLEKAGIFSDLASHIVASIGNFDGVVAASLHGAAGVAMATAEEPPEPEWSERTIIHLETALQTITRDVDETAWAYFRGALGVAYRMSDGGDRDENIETAIACFEDALSVQTPEADMHNWAVSTYQLGIAHLAQADAAGASGRKAMACFEDVLNRLEPAREWPLWADVQIALGRAWLEHDEGEPEENLAKALEAFDALRENAITFGKPLGEAHAYKETGAALEKAGIADTDRLIACYRKALDIYSPDNDWESWTWCSGNLARALIDRAYVDKTDDIEEAILLLRGVIARGREREIEVSGFIHAFLGNAYLLRKKGTPERNQDRAVSFYEKAAASEDAGSIPRIWCDLAFAFRNRTRGDRAANIERSLQCFETSVGMLAESGDDPDLRASLQAELAQTYLRRLYHDDGENIASAVNHASEALAAAPRGEHWRGRVAALQALGDAYEKLQALAYGEVDKAVEYLEEALQLCTERGDPHEAASIASKLGHAFLTRKAGDVDANVEAAIKHYTMALSLGEDDDNTRQAHWMQGLGLAYLGRRRGDPSENRRIALAHIRHAGEIGRDEFSASDLVAQNLAEARALMAMGREHWGEALHVIDRAFDASDDCWREAVTPMARAELIDAIVDAGGWAALAYAAQGDCVTALERLEAVRGVTLREMLTFERMASSEADDDRRAAIRNATKRVATLRAEATSFLTMTRPFLTVADELAAAQEELSDALRKAQGRAMAALGPVLASLPEGSVLITPVATEFGGIVFVVPSGVAAPDHRHVIEMPELTFANVRERRQKWSAAYGEACNPAPLDMSARNEEEAWRVAALSLQEITEWLGAKVMAPVLEKIRELEEAHRPPDGSDRSAHLVIMPTGDFGALPFHAALCAFDDAKRPLIREHIVSYTPSLQALKAAVERAQRTEQDASGGALALVNPGHDLRFGETIEAPALHRLFPDGMILVGDEASKEAFLEHAASRRYLHLSCHGRFDIMHPEQSGMKLASSEWLTLPEITGGLGIDRCRWLMLAACETAMTGLFHTVEESVGPITAFLMAGAACVTGALWAMPDVSAALVASRGYEEHLHRQLPPAQAVRAAVLWLMDLSRDDLRRIIGSEDGGAAWRYRLADIDDAPGAGGSAPDAERPFASPLFWAPFTVWGM